MEGCRMEWNWFFSALAQSAAALSGFIGGFVITAIINNQKSFKKNRERINYLLSESAHWRSTIQSQSKSKAIRKDDKIYIDLQAHIRDIKIVLSDAKCNPESSSLITFAIFSLVLLFFVSIIYPLSFLPIDPSSTLQLSFSAFVDIIFSLKGIMLMMASLIFVMIVSIFLYINITLRHNAEQINMLESCLQPDSYF
jgi:hypothetical protein